MNFYYLFNKKFKMCNLLFKVSEAYRLKVGERSRIEDEQRKKEGKDITIIDYSEIQEGKSSIIIPSAAASISSSTSTNLVRFILYE